MPNKKQLLQDITGEKATIYTVEKEFTGWMRKFGNEFSVAKATSNSFDIVRLKPSDVMEVRRIHMMPVIFVYNHFTF